MASPRSSAAAVRLLAGLLFPLLLFAAPGKVSGSIVDEIDAILDRPTLSGNLWSILIERENGDVLYSRSPNTPRRPASVTKLFPTAAAFDLLGPNHLWNGQRIDMASRPINRNSDNAMADNLFSYLGATKGNAATYAEGSRVVTNWVASIGIDTTGLVLNDGSGLSWGNRITPVQAIGVLRHALANHPGYLLTLSRASHYGTLYNRFQDTAGAGNVYGKTGTLPNGQTISLTGFIDHAGQRYFFSFFANNVANNATVQAATRQAIDDSVLTLTTATWISSVFSPGDWIRTTAGTLNMRSGPGTGYPIIGSLAEGTVVRALPHPNNGIFANGHFWWNARVHPDGPDGWLAETYLAAGAAPEDWPWQDVIVDNGDPGFSASANWGVAIWAADKFGADYHHRDAAPVDDRASWSADLPGSGSYDVFAWWPAWTNRASAAPYVVSHAEGTTTVLMDQTVNGGQWNHLGRFHFAHNSENQVALSCWTGSGEVVMADAVRFVAIDVAPPPKRHVLSVAITGSGTVERSPDAADYEEDQSVELLAVPEAGSSFTGWTGTIEATQNPLVVRMNGPVSVTAVFRRDYTAWKKIHFAESDWENPEISGGRAAPAGDRVPNLLKYALGLDPHNPVAAALPPPEIRAVRAAGGETFLTLTFTRPANLDDLEYRVELSHDLLDWSERAILVTEAEDNGKRTQTYRDTVPFAASEARFIRLQVIREAN